MKLSDKIIHINASPEFFSDSEAVALVNQMVETAYYTIKKKKMETTFVPKENESVEIYKGYLIVSRNVSQEVLIIEELAPGKFKTRRRIVGPKSHCDGYGNRLYKHIPVSEAVTKAKSFIDNFIKPWSESKHNKINN